MYILSSAAGTSLCKQECKQGNNSVGASWAARACCSPRECPTISSDGAAAAAIDDSVPSAAANNASAVAAGAAVEQAVPYLQSPRDLPQTV